MLLKLLTKKRRINSLWLLALQYVILVKIKISNGEYIAVKGKGKIAIRSISGTKFIKDVLLYLALCLIKYANDNDVFKVKMKGKSFALNPLKEKQVAFSTNVYVEVWDKRLGHFNHETIANLQRKELIQSLPCFEYDILNCRDCQQGKQSRIPFKQPTWRAIEKL
ncbi:Retrovirus-related Pol polyprotein from transposon TNT 1-94 [Gossypium australe]|uniref:Retrovirus-related Pol polyprotein from transposon TNT 1-94 n=1 Tax=Gossypium australe TaxID=47621 RepID=A0A5B6VMB0_9ROSI|nr:Retrovirus-related Pol polyprotein from transposon TNT 1-94 [Gossypium australe]